MATNQTKLKISQSLFLMLYSHVDEGTISRAEAEEITTVLAECIKDTNQHFINTGREEFITTAKPTSPAQGEATGDISEN